MKIALVHDYLKEIGGAERVLMALKEIWPQADVYTAYKFPEYWGQFKEKLEEWNIGESWGAYLPFLPKFISYYTVISPLFFTEMNLTDYDIVIVSATGGYFPNAVKIGENTRLVTYWHTPPRFLYGYPVATNARFKWYWRPFSEVANHILRIVDFKLAQKPHVVIANSKNVANRIRKFYRRESEVIYPPIETQETRNKKQETKRKDYFLIVSRIVGTKNIELAVEAANKYGFKLKVAGRPINKGGEEIAKKIIGKTVEYLGEVDEKTKETLFSEATGFLALESDADFGMSTVEPMVYGTPVVAFKAGGYLETVVEGKTGIFFEELTAESVWKAVQKFNKVKWDRPEISKSTKKYSAVNFKSRMIRLVGDTYAGIARN